MPGRRCVRMLTPPLLVLRVREQRSSSAVATASPASKSEAAHDDPHPKDPVPAAQVWAARPYYETSGTAGALACKIRSAVLLWLSPPASTRPGFERTNCRLGQGAHPDEVAAEPPLRFTELYRQPRRPSGPGMGYRAAMGYRASMGYRAAWDTAPPWDTVPPWDIAPCDPRRFRVCLFARSRLRVAAAANLGELVPEGGQGRTMATRTTGKTRWSRRSRGSCSAGARPSPTRPDGDVSQGRHLVLLGMIQPAPNR